MTDLLKNVAPWPVVDFSEFGVVTRQPLSRFQKIVASFMGRNWVGVPHVTHNDLADITDLETRRKALAAEGGPKLTVVPFLVKALADGLVAFPQFNASLEPDGSTLVRKDYVHIGVAVDTPNGLLVPVVRDCNTKTVPQLASEIASISEKARTKGLPLGDMSGGCITLTSLGHIGGTSFTPIVNVPEVAILGVTRARQVAQPGEDGGLVWRTMLPLSLSYDHRVINGADAARFCRFIADRLDTEDLFA